MKLKEVIVALQRHDPDAPVIVRGYESGFNRVLDARAVNIVSNDTQEWYDGEFDAACGEREQKCSIPAVELWGENTKRKDM